MSFHKSSRSVFFKTCTLLCSFITYQSAFAEREASTVIRYYEDGKTHVLSPQIEATSTFDQDRQKIGLHMSQDILSSASSEVRTYSSRGVIEDQRKEYQINYETQVPDGTLSLGAITSDEKDYRSRIISAGGTREFFTKNTVVGFGFSAGQDQINASNNPGFSEAMAHQVYNLSLSQIIDKNKLFQILYDFRVENGYLASPYRKAKLITSGGSIVALNENHPQTRNRHAIGFKYNVFLPNKKWSLASSYRLYFDSWDVVSNTFEERLTEEFSRKFELSGFVRFYWQKKAKFYQDYYHDDPGVFFTGNATLSGYKTLAIGVRPAWNVSERANISARFEVYKELFDETTDAGNLATLTDDAKLDILAFAVAVAVVQKF